ncbi:hypothetical protein [Salmonella enterica]|uniref:hypothetical protein n=1 Tax=Salmonella enterica TaxID=28901 RepID=UPI000B6141B1|nr:hypothetical protein [Salmonella enterica]ASD86209.1 hypothetical protein LFZ16_08135 [Salmonella enterica subsp. enterica serovar India str. SA20085604]
MNMPLREYYPVKRVGELLDFQIGDLFHWASIGAIKLYAPFEQCKGYVHFYDGSDDLEDKFIENRFASDGVSIVHHIVNVDCKDSVDFFNKDLPLKNTFPCFFSGFWSLPYSFYGYGFLLDVKTSFFDTWNSASNKMFVSFESEEFISIGIDDVYIMKSDFLLLKNCNDMGELPNYYNGGIVKSEPISSADTMPSHRTSATAINAIQVMAKKLYPKACNSPTHLANNLTAEAHKQGMTIQFDCGTVRRWIKQ